MRRFEIVKTQDGSLGLYNNEFNDVYHSKFGAYTESIEKFITPSNLAEFAQNNDNIRILDICYGIGYNTKSAIQSVIKANKDVNLSIDAIEPDQELVFFSALTGSSTYEDDINLKIGYEIIKQRDKFTLEIDKDFLEQFGQYCHPYAADKFIELFYTYTNTPISDLFALLHNIYYHSISNSYKKPSNAFKYNNISLNWYFEDARKTVQALKGQYDFIFLDAFTPSIMPSLWSYEFFTELYRLISPSGMFVTYSSAAPVRSALINAGFNIGKIIDTHGKSIGTTAAKDSNLIRLPLSDEEKGLLETKAGICYKDKGLNLSDECILENYRLEKLNSKRASSSSYMRKIGAKTCMI